MRAFFHLSSDRVSNTFEFKNIGYLHDFKLHVSIFARLFSFYVPDSRLDDTESATKYSTQQ